MEPDLKLIVTKTKVPDKYSTYFDYHIYPEKSESTTVEIWVWHQVLCNVSPFFRTLLAPERFAEGIDFHKNKNNVLELHDTDADAMNILCDVFHHRTDKVPKELTFHQLFHVSVLADKFDCVNSLQTWVPTWMEEQRFQWQRQLIVNKELQTGITKLLCVFLNLRYLEPVTDLRNTYIMHSREHDRDREANPFMDHLTNSFTGKINGLDMRFAADLTVDEAEATRVSVVTELRELMEQSAYTVQHGDTCQLGTLNINLQESLKQYYEDLELAYQCRSISLGNFTIACEDVFGPSWESSKVWEWSIQDIINHLRRFATELNGPKWLVRTNCKGSGMPTVESHAGCSLGKVIIHGIEVIMDRYDVIPRQARFTDPEVCQPTFRSRRYELLTSSHK